jgi:hypothetical protein
MKGQLMKKSIFILVIAFLSSCGREGTSTHSQNQSAFSNLSSDSLYYQLPAPDMGVNSNIYTGWTIEQRESSSQFCRRFKSFSSNAFSFICYQSSSSGTQAQTSFNNLKGSYSSYSVTIGNFVGSAFVDEITNGNMYGGGSLLCQKLTPQNPSATSSYRCFQKIN